MFRRKTSFVLLLIVMVSLGLGACQDGGNSADSEFAVFRGDLQHTGVYETNGPHQDPKVKWTFPTEGQIRATPTVSNQVVYIGSDDQYFYAIDAVTGEDKWKFKTEGAIKSTAAVLDELVYVLSTDGNLYALDTKKGEVKWTFDTEGTYEPRDIYDYWQSSPMVYNDVVYFGGPEGVFYALQADDGQVKWKKALQFQNYDDYKDHPVTLHSSPAVHDGIVYIGLSGILDIQLEPGNIIALDAESGEQIWASNFIQAVDASPVIDEAGIYVGLRNSGFTALDITTGKMLWKSSSVSYSLSSPALYNGILYSGSSDQKKLAAIDITSGQEKWFFQAAGPIHSSPAIDSKNVYFAAGNNYDEANLGFVYAVDAATGEVQWQYQTGGNIYSSPVLADGVLYIGNDDGKVYALE
jgi:outer membrane protein assembly factor BamB